MIPGDLDAGTGHRQGGHAAEAVADRGDGRSGFGAVRKRGQPGQCAISQSTAIGLPGTESGHDALTRTGDLAAVHVAREDDVTERCKAGGLIAGVLIEPSPAVDKQDRRLAGCLVGKMQGAFESRAVIGILDGPRLGLLERRFQAWPER